MDASTQLAANCRAKYTKHEAVVAAEAQAVLDALQAPKGCPLQRWVLPRLCNGGLSPCRLQHPADSSLHPCGWVALTHRSMWLGSTSAPPTTSAMRPHAGWSS